MDKNIVEQFYHETKHSTAISKEQLSEYALDLLQTLIEKCLQEETFDIGIMRSNNKWALISYDNLNSDIQLSLRYNSNGFDVYLSYYDDNNEDDVSFSHLLTTDELSIVPEVLQTLM